MKLHAQPTSWAHRAWTTVALSVDERHAVARATSGLEVVRDTVIDQASTGGSYSRPMNVVRLLALCQALLFLALFLFICAQASAAKEGGRSFNPELSRSVYAPEAKQRLQASP